MQRLLIATVMLFSACSHSESALDVAKRLLGQNARCVSSTGDLLYCTAKGHAFMCDSHDCVEAADARKAMLEMDADQKRKDDKEQSDDSSSTADMNMMLSAGQQ